jgi:DUF971 family protein
LEHALGVETTSAYTKDRSFEGLGTFGDGHLTGRREVELIKTHASSLHGNDDVIYILRDGRDATASYWHYVRDWEREPTGSFTEFLHSLPSRGNWWAFHIYSWLEVEHPHRLLLVRYEDLWRDQVNELGRMLDYLGLEPIRPFTDYGAKISFENLHANEPTFFRSGRIGAWRETFSREDERFFLEHDLGYLTRLGYARVDEDTSRSLTLSEPGSVALLKSQIRRSIELERALAEKEQVIRGLHSEAELRRARLEELAADRDGWEARYQQVAAEAELRRARLEELERTLMEARAAWGKEREALSEELQALQSEYDELLKRPLQIFRKAWLHRANKRWDAKG